MIFTEDEWMYAYIKGEIVDITEDNLVLECNNIGYNIRIPYSVAQKLPGIGETVKIYTYTSVREDAFNLFGFLSKDDLEVYKLLIAVNGIGPKGALSILSAMSADDLRFAIISGDSKAISKAQGVGNKSAERIILELKDKIKMFGADDTSENTLPSGGAALGDAGNQAMNEAIEALTALGYSPSDALKAVKRADITEDMDSGAILKATLRVISTL
jgi:Holliday junction DNA helicase RuvA